MEHPDQHIGFALRVQVVQLKEVYKNKEDSHGGPGYYPSTTTIASSGRKLVDAEVPAVIEKVAKGDSL